MKLMVTGHRIEKLATYDISWIRSTIGSLVHEAGCQGYGLGMSGMASGVDLWFCQACLYWKMPYAACVPFDGQEEFMSAADAFERKTLLDKAALLKKVRNNYMVERCHKAIVVWDGNKGGTHNCFQQLLELKKDLWWIIPNKQKVVEV